MVTHVKKCFVAMPADDVSRMVFEAAVEPALRDAGFEYVQDDVRDSSRVMRSSLWQQIQEVDVMIADVTGNDPHVFFELGFAQASSKPAIIIAREAQDVPFDLAHLQVLRYKDGYRSIMELRRLLTELLRREIDRYSQVDKLASAATRPVDEIRVAHRIQELTERADELRQGGDLVASALALEEALELQQSDEDSSSTAEILNTLGATYQALGRNDEAIAALQRSFSIVRREGRSVNQAATAANLANVLVSSGDLHRAKLLYGEAFEIAASIGDERLATSVRANLAHLHAGSGDLETAESTYREVLDGFSRLGDERALAQTYANLAAVLASERKLEEAQGWLEKAKHIFEKMSDQFSLAPVLHNLALIQIQKGDFEAAKHLLEQSIATKRSLGSTSGISRSLANLGYISFEKGDVSGALEYYRQAADIQEHTGEQLELVNTLLMISQLLMMVEEYQSAYEFLGRARSLAEAVGAIAGDSIGGRILQLEELLASKRSPPDVKP